MAAAPESWHEPARVLARAFGVPDEVEMLHERQFMRQYVDRRKPDAFWIFQSYEGYNEVEGFFDGFQFQAANLRQKWDIQVTWAEKWDSSSVSSRVIFQADHAETIRCCGSREHECSYRLARWLMRLGEVKVYDAVVEHFRPPFPDRHQHLEWHLMVRENQGQFSFYEPRICSAN